MFSGLDKRPKGRTLAAKGQGAIRQAPRMKGASGVGIYGGNSWRKASQATREAYHELIRAGASGDRQGCDRTGLGGLPCATGLEGRAGPGTSGAAGPAARGCPGRHGAPGLMTAGGSGEGPSRMLAPRGGATAGSVLDGLEAATQHRRGRGPRRRQEGVT